MKSPEIFELTFFKGVKQKPKKTYAEYAYLFQSSDDYGRWKEKKTYHKGEKKK